LKPEDLIQAAAASSIEPLSVVQLESSETTDATQPEAVKK
jgi:hypothetical protein